MPERNSGTSDYAVLHAIKETCGKTISYVDIAMKIGCSESSVYRAVKRLKQARRLEVVSINTRGGGCVYLVKS